MKLSFAKLISIMYFIHERMDVFITDVKFDDLLAWYVYLTHRVQQKRLSPAQHKNNVVVVVLSDILYIECAALLMERVRCEIDQEIKVEYFAGDRRQQEHKHEEIFKGEHGFDQVAQVQPGKYSSVYMFAPFKSVLEYFEGSTRLYLSMGHNLNSSELDIDKIHEKFKEIVTMNNFVSFQSGQEGGRLSLADTEYLVGGSPTLQKCIGFARRNSIQFMADQLCKVCDDMHKNEVIEILNTSEFEASIKKHSVPERIGRFREFVCRVFHKKAGEPLRLSQNFMIENPTKSYIDRVVDQIYNGIMIESTDALHLASFYTETFTKERGSFVTVMSSDDKKETRFQINAAGNVSCVKNLTNALVLAAVIAKLQPLPQSST